MDVNRIVSELDTEIARLQHIRAALVGADGATGGAAPAKGKRGRPKGSKNVAAKAAATKTTASKTATPAKSSPKKGKRVLSTEGRKRIADAMKRRWAERRKQTAK